MVRLGIRQWLLAGLCLLGLAGCGEAPVNNPRAAFDMTLGSEPPSLDPARATDLTSFTVLANIWRGLVQFGPDGVEPAVAHGWEISEDRRTYTFHLNPEARWHDAQLVVAADFIRAWRRVLSPETGSEYAFFLFHIKGARDFYEGRTTDFEKVAVQAPDPQTLVVTLEKPVPFFLEILAAPVALPIRQEMLGSGFDDVGDFMTNGPFALTRWQHDERIELKPAPTWWKAKRPTLPVQMWMVAEASTSTLMYENGALDFIETTTSIQAADIQRLRKHPDAHRFPLLRVDYYGFNTQKPPFDDAKVRQAFSLALDRQAMNRLMGDDQIATRCWLPLQLVDDPAAQQACTEVTPQPETAQALLAEAGYPNGKGFPEVTLMFRGGYDASKRAEIAQYQWQQALGVRVRLAAADWQVLLSKLGSNNAPEIWALGWYADYADPDTFMSLFVRESGNNYTRWQNPDYDKLVYGALAATQPAERTAMYLQAQQLLVNDAAAIMPLVQGRKLYLVKPWVTGLVVTPLNLILLDGLSAR